VTGATPQTRSRGGSPKHDVVPGDGLAAVLHMAETLSFEGAPQRVTDGAGIRGFAEGGSGEDRRKLVMNFWQD
jgi:hypothetical protein